jgi:hypothetical protein
LRARECWGVVEPERFWARFQSEWRARLLAGDEAGGYTSASAETANGILRQEHAAEAHVDLEQTHHSWWLRALQDESPAVQRAVAAHAPAPVGPALRRGLLLADEDLQADRMPHAEALRWVLALWTERLVGGPAAGRDDPPVIAALTQLDRHSRYRLTAAVGLAKLSLALEPTETEIELAENEPMRPRDRDRLSHFRATWESVEPRFAQVARQDLATARSSGDSVLQRLGLITFGRILVVAEPYRVRWALQHVPYQVAKFTRSRMSVKNPLVSGPTLVAWETQIFGTACARLRSEGRLPQDWGT